ncbi:MAG: hypothetical protein CO189_11060 [candidate division Zixibacteria bacterium CG_4_9_14_3_um_filter_46_8]|nr:MAG: hypothetical protein CO189_11060 [candidate division Zixibacteria bacterium CG_4_9_14_3_um_filter_46_8]
MTLILLLNAVYWPANRLPSPEQSSSYLDIIISLGYNDGMKDQRFTIIYTKEKHWIVARCVEIDVVSQGKTMKSAEKNIKEAISLFIESFGLP